MATKNELFAILPIMFLAIIYLGRDILRFNKLRVKGCMINFSKSQLKVAIFCYPVWVFLIWIENIAQKRNDYFVVIVMNTVTTYIKWWTTIAVLNDKFDCSNQQIGSLVFSFVLNATWRFVNILIFN